MQMREFGVAGQPDAAERRAGLDALTLRDADAALGHVTVLRHPAVWVTDHDAVAAFTAFDGFGRRIPDRDVGDAVACADHYAGRRGQHVDARALLRHARQPEIGAVMTFI